MIVNVEVNDCVWEDIMAIVEDDCTLVSFSWLDASVCIIGCWLVDNVLWLDEKVSDVLIDDDDVCDCPIVEEENRPDVKLSEITTSLVDVALWRNVDDDDDESDCSTELERLGIELMGIELVPIELLSDGADDCELNIELDVEDDK